MTTVVISCASPWFRVTGPVAAVVLQSLSFRSSRVRTVSTLFCVATATETHAPLVLAIAPHGATDRWSRATGAVLIVARKSLAFLLNRVVTAQSAAATATAQVVPHGMIVAGKPHTWPSNASKAPSGAFDVYQTRDTTYTKTPRQYAWCFCVSRISLF